MKLDSITRLPKNQNMPKDIKRSFLAIQKASINRNAMVKNASNVEGGASKDLEMVKS